MTASITHYLNPFIAENAVYLASFIADVIGFWDSQFCRVNYISYLHIKK